MKQIYILTAILFFNSIILNAQVEDLLDPTGTGITGFLLVGNELYYTQSDDIFKIDITVTSPTPVNIISGLSEPTGLLLNGNDLYFAQAASNRVSKIDITASTPTITDVVTGLNEPAFLALNGTDLYISEVGAGKISKIDITASLPVTATTVATGFNKPLQLALNGNDLYISETDGNKISKIDITASLPITATDVLTTDLDSPEVLASNASHLYFSANSSTNGFARIARISFSTLSINENILEKKVTIFPNPSKSLLHVSGLVKNENYSIYSVLGTKIMSSVVSNKEDINIENLANGLYFLKFENGNTLKFLKE